MRGPVAALQSAVQAPEHLPLQPEQQAVGGGVTCHRVQDSAVLQDNVGHRHRAAAPG